MYLVMGATGHTGTVIAKGLLAQNKKVRAVARSLDRLSPLVALGAEPFVGDVTSKEVAKQAFSGIDAAYVMIPPDMANPDFRGYQQNLADTIGVALEASTSVKNVVVLSSFGADKAEKTGPILGVHFLEERLQKIANLNVLYVRAGYFMENTLGLIGVIRQAGVVLGPLNPDLKVPMIATSDIGRFALAELLKLDFQGHKTQELQGQRDLTYTEATTIIGAAIGKPDLQYRQISSEQFSGALVQMGVSPNVAGLMAEMVDAQNAGHVRTLEPRSPRNTTSTSFEQFVAETFAPAFRAASAGA